MNQQEKMVWAAVYAGTLIEANRCSAPSAASVIAIVEADGAIRGLRRYVKKHGGRLHANDCLEDERRAELDILEPGTS